MNLGLNLQRYLYATLIVLAFIFVFDWFVHGFLLHDKYAETPHIWRETESLLLRLCYQFALAAWVVFLFTRFYGQGGLINGIFFGFYMGVFAGILTSIWYVWLPVAPVLSSIWLVAGIVEGLGVGLLLGIIYRS